MTVGDLERECLRWGPLTLMILVGEWDLLRRDGPDSPWEPST
jgi:hypothetical protein